MSSTFASALSLGSLNFTSGSIKPAKLTLTPHHTFYLLSRFEELGVEIGPMSVRIENIHSEQSPANYVSFLNHPLKPKGRSDRDSIHSVSSMRSVMSNMTSFWSSIGIGSGSAKTDKAQAQLSADIKYLYSAFTKIPCLRLSPDHRARLIKGYEEFPFDTAVPLWVFKNLSALEIYDLDFRQFFGWDKLADQLRSLTLKRSNVEDPLDLIVHIVLDDMDKRRRRSSKPQSPPTPIWPASPAGRHMESSRLSFNAGTPEHSHMASSASPRSSLHTRGQSEILIARSARNKSSSPSRPTSARQSSSYRQVKSGNDRLKRSGSGSSNSSTHSLNTSRNRSSSNLLSMGILPASKWRFLRHLSLADNSLTSLTSSGLAPLANTLQSLDISSNLFTEVPDCLAILAGLRALNLANCMIESLHSLSKSPLPAITALNLRSNRLRSMAGIERLFSLERLDVRENQISDPTEFARLTGIPDVHEIYVVGNPLVKLHNNYRLTIFNLFRAAPGYTEDIAIDSSGPGYGERRNLKERATESAVIPVAKAPEAPSDWPASTSAEISRIPSSVASRVVPTERPIPQSTQSEAIVGSTRRKKGSKRRIVDLSHDESMESQPKRSSIESLQRMRGEPISVIGDLNTSAMQHPPPLERISKLESDPFVPATQGSSNPSARMEIEGVMMPSETSQPLATLTPDQSLLADELKNLELSGNAEAYRQKVEAMKAQFGASWLQMLSEEQWDPRHPRHPTTPITSLRTPSQSIISSGRTLG